MATLNRITPCLWFDSQAEEAAEFYVSVFPNSRITTTTHYTDAGREVHGREPGSVMTVAFELDGHGFIALNGGPVFQFNEAVSFQINCRDQAEIDRYWALLTAGGDERAQQCGWLKDKFGLSWQVVPANMDEIMDDSDPERAGRVMNAMLPMKKIDMAELERAYNG
jgi:predicted 3-demethylubiquinone-9 3-methyltransferase (glyoxalase superfamily)